MPLGQLTRLRWRTGLQVILILLLFTFLQTPTARANALKSHPNENSDDYGSEGDASDAGGAQNDDIFDPASQQQEIEAEEHRVQANEMDFESATEAKAKAPATMHNMLNNGKLSSSSEEYYDDEQLREQRKENMKPQTTIIPEYVQRQGKSERNPSSQIDAKDNETNVSTFDYVDEETPEERNIKMLIRKNQSPYHEPRAIQFYQNDATNDDNEETIIRKFLEKKQQQLLPKQHISRDFIGVTHQDHHDDNQSQYDEYNDDSGEYSANHPIQSRKSIIAPKQEFADTYDPTDKPSIQQQQQQQEQQQQSITPQATTITIESTHAPAIMTTQAPLTATLSSAATIASPAAAPAVPQPLIPHGTTLPTPLALGSFITTSATATGLSSSSSSITTTTPHSLVPASAATATVTVTTTQAPATTTTTLATPIMTTTTTTTTTTTSRPGGKQGKQINISRRKLQPHEKLRNYIEDAYIRMPLAVIVDPSPESLEKTKTLWRDALRTNYNIKIVLVSLNDSGVPAAFNFNNTRQFLAGLNSIKEHAGGDAFIGIVHASELVPYDSAVFISTATLPPHTELVQDAAITLLKKRIRLYLLWFGERSLSENETQEAVGGILGEVAIRSGGDILHIAGADNSQEIEGGNTLVLVADAFRGSQEIEIPADTTLSSLHVKIDAPTRTAILETPNGDINLKKLLKLRSHILTPGTDDQRLDAYVPLTKLHRANIFILKIVPDSLIDEYTVFVRADRKSDHFLEEMIRRFDTYFMGGAAYYPTRFLDHRLKNILVPTTKTHDNLKFPDTLEENELEKEIPNENQPKDEIETFSTSEIQMSTNGIEMKNMSADMPSTRQILENQQQARNLLQMSVTKIEMGAQSQLLVAPGMVARLIFELTNTRSEAVFHNIQVVDERRYLLRLIPQSVFLRPGETANVEVTVLVPQGTPQGTVDHITFTCHGSGSGSGTTSLSLNLKVITAAESQDNVAPSISWTFGSRCDSIAADSPNCAERFWTLDITAQDWESGILRLQSTPTNRLFYRNSYTVGSSEPLKATYAATCCEPKVSVLAYDVAGNQRSYSIDVRDIVLTEASIAAIVLGALLLLLLIILIIWGIVYCCRRRKVVLDLPTYRSHSTRSME